MLGGFGTLIRFEGRQISTDNGDRSMATTNDRGILQDSNSYGRSE